MKLHIKKGDNVKVIAGENKGKTGRVLSVDPTKFRAVVEEVNMIKRHVKPSAQNPDGGIVEKEGTIHISNLMVVDGSGNVSRVGRSKDKDGKSVRTYKKTGEEIK